MGSDSRTQKGTNASPGKQKLKSKNKNTNICRMRFALCWLVASTWGSTLRGNQEQDQYFQYLDDDEDHYEGIQIADVSSEYVVPYKVRPGRSSLSYEEVQIPDSKDFDYTESLIVDTDRKMLEPIWSDQSPKTSDRLDDEASLLLSDPGARNNQQQPTCGR